MACASSCLGVYPGHVRLITQVVPGAIIVNKNGTDTALAVGEGLIEVTQTHVWPVTPPEVLRNIGADP